MIIWCLATILELHGKTFAITSAEPIEYRHTTMPSISPHTLLSEYWYPIPLTWHEKVHSLAKQIAAPSGYGTRTSCTAGRAGNYYTTTPISDPQKSNFGGPQN